MRAKTTSLPRGTIAKESGASATLSSTACTSLVPSAKRPITQHPTRKPSVIINNNKSWSVNHTTCLNSWGYWAQYCDSVYVAESVHGPLSLPQLCPVAYCAFRYPFDIPYNTSVPHWAYLDDRVNALDQLAFHVPDGLAIGQWI